MVLRGRTLYFSEFPGKRGASVPVHIHRVEEFKNEFDSDLEPQLFNRTSRIFLDTDDFIGSNSRPERDLVRNISKVYFSSVHPPSPIVMDSSYSPPLVEETTTTYSVPYTSVGYGHVPRARVPSYYNYVSSARTLPSYPRSYSTDLRRRTWVNGLRPVATRKRTSMDDEVEAFLASTPRYSSYTPSFRSRSTPGVSYYNSTYTGTPSYATQHLYRPPTWTPSTSGWTSTNSYAPRSVARSPSVLRSSSVVRSPSVARRPYSMAFYRHTTPVLNTTVSTDLTHSAKPPVPTYGSTYKLHTGGEYNSPSNLRSGRSRSRFSEAPYSAQPARKPRSASVAVDAPRPIVNYKDVKAPMSDTRRKVRDLICKTRKDPNYYN